MDTLYIIKRLVGCRNWVVGLNLSDSLDLKEQCDPEIEATEYSEREKRGVKRKKQRDSFVARSLWLSRMDSSFKVHLDLLVPLFAYVWRFLRPCYYRIKIQYFSTLDLRKAFVYWSLKEESQIDLDVFVFSIDVTSAVVQNVSLFLDKFEIEIRFVTDDLAQRL